MEVLEVHKKGKVIRFLLCLTVSVFIWGYVTNMHNPIQSKIISNVPVQIVNSETLETQNLAIDTSSLLSGVNVVVEGRYSDIQSIETSDVSVTMDLEDLALKEGTNTVAIDTVSNNPALRIVDKKTPTQLKIEVSKLLQKEFPVVIAASGDLPDNYVSGEPILPKDKVIASGTKEALDDIKYIVANVDLNNATRDINKNVTLKAINKVGNETTSISLKDKELNVHIPINYVKEVKISLDIKNQVPKGKVLDKYTFDTNTIKIIGKKNVLDKINEIKTEALDLSRRFYDFEKRVPLVFPEGVKSKNNITSVYTSFIIQNK